MGAKPRKQRVDKLLKNNPDYQRLLRYYAKEDRLEANEQDYCERGVISELNITRGLLFVVRGQIQELEEMLGLIPRKQPVG